MEAVAKLQAGLVSGLMPTVHTPEVVARYRATTPGTPDRKSRSFRLAWEGSARPSAPAPAWTKAPSRRCARSIPTASA
jgi:hypothetical protein